MKLMIQWMMMKYRNGMILQKKTDGIIYRSIQLEI